MRKTYDEQGCKQANELDMGDVRICKANSTGAKSRGQEGQRSDCRSDLLIRHEVIVGCNFLQHKDKKWAFTLAETLITLVIVGVVAALTIPSMLHRYQDMERTAKIKKTYSTLGNALTYVIADGGTLYFDNPADDQATMNNWYDSYLKKRLNVMKVCKGGINEISDCWKQPTCLSGGCGGYGTGNALIAALLTDGTSFMADRWTPSTFGITSRYDRSDTGMVFYFDINGKKKPNKIGEDIYVAVFVSREGFIPAYRDKTQEEVDRDCSKAGLGISCIRRYLKNEK